MTVRVLMIGALLCLATPALAQGMRCLPREALVEKLEAKYRETLTGGGLQSPQQVLEIWVSAETGTWTVFFTRPNGLSCIVATGKNWRAHGPERTDPTY